MMGLQVILMSENNRKLKYQWIRGTLNMEEKGGMMTMRM
jgi:hypothetical protein